MTGDDDLPDNHERLERDRRALLAQKRRLLDFAPSGLGDEDDTQPSAERRSFIRLRTRLLWAVLIVGALAVTADFGVGLLLLKQLSLDTYRDNAAAERAETLKIVRGLAAKK